MIKVKVPLKRSTIASKGVKKRKVTTPLSKAKKTLWGLVRLLVFKTYGTDCYTCEAKDLVGKNLQGGHVPWPKATLSAECAHDIRFIRAQCMSCNIHKGGMGAEAIERMKRSGIDTDALKLYNRQTTGKKYDILFYERRIAEVTALLEGNNYPEPHPQPSSMSR